MTTTGTFQGLNEEAKPSSRVLRPPGGGSSNIFGPPEPVQPSPSKPYQRSNLLGGAEPAAQPAQTAQTKQDDVPKDRLFGDAPPKESPKPASNARQGAYNPITGEAYDKPAEKVNSTSRGRQPPGGASSGIF